MNKVLVTGATTFLGFHVTKRLNQLGHRPRVLELPGSNERPLELLNVDRCPGTLAEISAIQAASEGIDTLIHVAFKVSLGGGQAVLDDMRRVNVDGTVRLLDTAAAGGVTRAVVTGSALAIGVNRRPLPLNEAGGREHVLDLPYAAIRREAEEQSLAKARALFAVMSVAPSFTLGPEDPVGAPANKLVKAVMNGKLPFVPPTVGFGCLDVRDFAIGALLAAEHGGSGRRYILSGDNVTTKQFLETTTEAAGVKPPRLHAPVALLKILVAGVEGVSRLRRRPPPVTRAALQILGRYAWYDTTRARTELGWTPRPLRETVADTVRWLREQPS
jgi:dihydroflavonol-4-reductase